MATPFFNKQAFAKPMVAEQAVASRQGEVLHPKPVREVPRAARLRAKYTKPERATRRAGRRGKGFAALHELWAERRGRVL